LYVLSDVRLYREGLAISLARHADFDVIGAAAAAPGLEQMAELAPDVAVLDAALSGGDDLTRRLRLRHPLLKVVAVSVAEDDREVMGWAEAGVAAYVGRDGSGEDLARAIRQAMRGELTCSARVASMLFGRIAALSDRYSLVEPEAALTRREAQIAALLERSLSNKEIARRLEIGAPTVKNHVHNILEKLGVHSRAEVAVLSMRRRLAGEPDLTTSP